jgi:hypothetical protein
MGGVFLAREKDTFVCKELNNPVNVDECLAEPFYCIDNAGEKS